MTIEYNVKSTRSDRSARITQDEKIIADLREGRDLISQLITADGKTYFFDPKVNGRISPFSMTVYEETTSESRKTDLKIKGHIFPFDGQIYMIGGVPEGKSRKELGASKYITRLVNFPYENLDQIDMHVRERLGRHRGVEVGEISGLGRSGYTVKLADELEKIALPLTVASYLLYTTR